MTETAENVTREQLVGSHQTREFAFVVDKRSIDEEKRTVEVAFASEEPVRRWWGDEILEITSTAIRGGRLDNGAAGLVNHDRDQHVSVVESWSIGADRKARCVLRFGRGKLASEILQDIVDGIRRHISVGYIVHSYRVENPGKANERTIIDDWEPVEVSVVSIPADGSVGVGRSHEAGTVATAPTGADGGDRDHGTANPSIRTMKTKPGEQSNGESTEATPAAAEGRSATPPAAPAAPATASATEDIEGERRRAAEILEIGARFGVIDQAREAVTTGKSVIEFQRGVLKGLESKPLSQRSPDVGLSEKERRSYSFIRLLNAITDPQNKRAQELAGFELECHDALVRSGLSNKKGGILVPDEVLRERAFSPFNTGTSGTNTGDTGGNVVATELLGGSFIDMLRNRAAVLRRARTMMGLVGNIDIPKQTGGAQGYWMGEDDQATVGSQALGQISLSPKTVGAYSEITRKLLMQNSVDVEQLVRADLANALALTIDLAALYGDPDDDANSPRGIKYYDGINTADLADGDAPTYAELVKMESEIAADNADVDSMAYFLNAKARGALKTTQKFSGTNGAPVWEPNNTVNGYAVEVTNQVADGDIFFGNFADLIVGMWGGFELLADPYTHSLRGRLRIVVFQDCDFAVRRTESFCYATEPEA